MSIFAGYSVAMPSKQYFTPFVSKPTMIVDVLKVQMTKIYISLFFIKSLKALFQGSYCRKPHAKILVSP